MTGYTEATINTEFAQYFYIEEKCKLFLESMDVFLIYISMIVLPRGNTDAVPFAGLSLQIKMEILKKRVYMPFQSRKMFVRLCLASTCHRPKAYLPWVLLPH